MALPTESTSFLEYFQDLLFTAAYLKGTRGFGDLAKKILEARKRTAAAIIVRNEAQDEAVLANVAQAIAWDAMKAPLESFERQVDAHFDDDRVKYGEVFTRTVSVMLRASDGARAGALEPVLKFARRNGLPQKVAAAGKTLVEAWDDYAAKAKAAHEAERAVTRAVADVAVAKRAGIIVMREAEGSLRVHFASDLSQARKFFRPKKKAGDAKKKNAAPAPAPAGGGGGPRPA